MTKKQRLKWGILGSQLLLILSAIIYFISTFDFVVVSGESMLPTLQDNDLLVVKKVDYSDLRVNDIIVFDSDSTNRELIKRVVALEGDTVDIRHNGVYVNGVLSDTSYTKDKGYVYARSFKTVVDDESLFVLGDNRAVSVDSRSSNVGLVSAKQIKGVLRCNISGIISLSASEIVRVSIRIFLLSLALLGLVKIAIFLDRKLKFKGRHRSC